MNKLIFFPTLLLCFSCGQADFRDAALGIQNALREKHHSPPLSLSDDLNNYAQNWAQRMADTGEFEHSNGPYGENLWATSGVSISDEEAAKKAVNAWYSEVSKYDYNKPGFQMGTGHFTQVVWKSTKYFGIGVARSAWAVYVSGTYDPPGNYEGEFPYNVLPQ